MALTAKARRAALRQSLLFGAIIGPACFWGMRFLMTESRISLGTNSFLLGELTAWPPFMSSFLPLDLLVCIGAMVLMGWQAAIMHVY